MDAEGYTFPLDLGAKGSCTVGGNLATNAGGINFIRHNSLHANCIGLKAVLPDGRVIDDMKALRKDNTGYDLKHLFIGAEGTLGIITECAILCPASASNKKMAFVACNSFEDIVKVMIAAKKALPDIISAFEFMDYQTVNLVFTHAAGRDKFPFKKEFPFYAIVEIATLSSENEND